MAEKHEICVQERKLGAIEAELRAKGERIADLEKDTNHNRKCLIELKLKQDAKPTWAVTVIITFLVTISTALAVYIVTDMEEPDLVEETVDVVISLMCGVI